MWTLMVEGPHTRPLKMVFGEFLNSPNFHPFFWHSAPQYQVCLQIEQRLKDSPFFPQCEHVSGMIVQFRGAL